MNSSVTLDRAISVMSSLCLEIRPSRRSKGPSKTSRCTWKPPPAGPGSPAAAAPATASPVPGSPAARAPIAGSPITRARLLHWSSCWSTADPPPVSRLRPPPPRLVPPLPPAEITAIASRLLLQPLGHDAVLAGCLQVGEQHGQRLADNPAAVDRDPVAAQDQLGPFQLDELGAGEVDGDLLWMAFPAACLAFGFWCRAARGRA